MNMLSKFQLSSSSGLEYIWTKGSLSQSVNEWTEVIVEQPPATPGLLIIANQF